MIIIPDIHGRTFWKEVVNKYESEDIIFLGDYLDPYPIERISKDFAIENFKEIIEFKKTHMDNVTLLLGNHDFMSYIFPEMGTCRTDIKNIVIIRDLFKNNKELFKIADIRNINNKKYTFSHAPLILKWVTNNPDLCDLKDSPEKIINFLQDLYINEPDKLCRLINQVGYYRGGWSKAGSIVWADVREISCLNYEWENYYQIFGHTQLKNEPVITEYFADLDCQYAFILDNEGNLTKIEKVE